MSASVKLAPSILSADFTRLGDQIRDAEEAGADWIHVDVMDGHFVPNITMGPMIAAAARRCTDLPIDAHLMIESPERYVSAFADAGMNTITVHIETSPHLHRTIQQIREAGASPGVALNPATPVETLLEVLPLVDLVLVMSVNPGFGGQRYIPNSTSKIERLRALGGALGAKFEIQVDGGVDAETAPAVAAAGATVLVAGSAVYNQRGSVRENLYAIRGAIDAGS